MVPIDGNNNDDNNNDDEFTPDQVEFLKQQFQPGEYAMLTILVKLPQLENFIDLLYESGLDLAVTGSISHELDEMLDDDPQFKGNAKGSSHGRN
jgi:hypothetical protein